jgi:hypothetical protein
MNLLAKRGIMKFCALGISVAVGLTFFSAALKAEETYVSGGIPGKLVNVAWDTFRDQPADSWRPFPARQAWFKTIEMPDEGRWTSVTKQLISVNCQTQKIAILRSIEELPGDKKGINVQQPDRSSAYDYAIPDSTGFSMLNALCEH